MNINVELSAENTRKSILPLKPRRKDGLILQLHHAVKDQSVRFTQACFNNIGQILVCITNKGDIFIINFTLSKFWFLINICSCTVLYFLPHMNNEIIVGISNGVLYVINIDEAKITNTLIGHSSGVTEISFSTDTLCVSSSSCEAIVWDLNNCSKLQVLSLSQDTILKHVMFMPVTNNILGSFHDDSIYVWKFGTFELLKQITPATWNRFLVKTITFTRNGRAMILAGHSPKLIIFLTDCWEVAKTIVLPNTIHGVKKLDFISQPFDGGSNRILSILTSSGVLYFFDMELDSILSKISLDEGIYKFHNSSDGKYTACILTSGLTNVYSLSSYVMEKQVSDNFQEVKLDKIKLKTQQAQKKSSVISAVNEKMKNVLDRKKLQAILKEFGQYPDAYRLKIWSQLLELPNNKVQYNNVINHISQTSFENLGKEYPIEDKLALKNLKKLLNNLVTWCPFFAEINYLPVFVFPFVKVFRNEPVLCFEAVCTVIVNWCQHWFEYYPLPPINILAMIENVLLEHDPDLLSHLNTYKVTSKIYAWPLLETIFSEVLTSSDWLTLWDHILSNEPSYILMIVVSYNIIFRGALIKILDETAFHVFYRNQNLTDVKKLISKSYELLKSTSDRIHPRQYLNYFKKLDSGSYPIFIDYPKTVVTYQNSGKELKQTSQLLQHKENQILTWRQNEISKLREMQINLEENLRLAELEKVCKLRLNEEKEQVETHRRRLEMLKKQVYDEEIEILTISRDSLRQKSSIDKQKYLENLLLEMEQRCSLQDLNVLKAESSLIKHYADLLKHKQQIEELLNSEPYNGPSQEHNILLKEQEKLAEEIEKVKSVSQSKCHFKQLNIATGLITVDNLIKKIEKELEQQILQGKNSSPKNSNIKQLQLETLDVEMEIKKLLQLLSHIRSNKSCGEGDDFFLLREAMKRMNEEFKAPAASS